MAALSGATWVLLIPGLALAFFGYPIYKWLIHVAGQLIGAILGAVLGGAIGLAASGSLLGAALGAAAGAAIIGALGGLAGVLVHYLTVAIPGFVGGFYLGAGLTAFAMVAVGARDPAVLGTLGPADVGGALLVLGLAVGILGALLALFLEELIVALAMAGLGAVLFAMPFVSSMPPGITVPLLLPLCSFIVVVGAGTQLGVFGEDAGPGAGVLIWISKTLGGLVLAPIYLLWRILPVSGSIEQRLGLFRPSTIQEKAEEDPELWLRFLEDDRRRVFFSTTTALRVAHDEGALPHHLTDEILERLIQNIGTELTVKSSLALGYLEKMRTEGESLSSSIELKEDLASRLEERIQALEDRDLDREKEAKLLGWIEEQRRQAYEQEAEARLQAEREAARIELDEVMIDPEELPEVSEPLEGLLLDRSIREVKFSRDEAWLCCRRRDGDFEVEVGSTPHLRSVLDMPPDRVDVLRDLQFDLDARPNPVRRFPLPDADALAKATGLVQTVFQRYYSCELGALDIETEPGQV